MFLRIVLYAFHWIKCKLNAFQIGKVATKLEDKLVEERKQCGFLEISINVYFQNEKK